jgi:hypothetical protein
MEVLSRGGWWRQNPPAKDINNHSQQRNLVTPVLPVESQPPAIMAEGAVYCALGGVGQQLSAQALVFAASCCRSRLIFSLAFLRTLLLGIVWAPCFRGCGTRDRTLQYLMNTFWDVLLGHADSYAFLGPCPLWLGVV